MAPNLTFFAFYQTNVFSSFGTGAKRGVFVGIVIEGVTERIALR